MEPRSDWDTMRYGDGTDADATEMERGHHYDYQAPAWVEGHDHAHFENDTSPLFFCGADEITCLGKEG